MFSKYVIFRNNKYIPSNAQAHKKGFKISADKSGAIDSAKFILAVLEQQRKDLERAITALGVVAVKIKKIDQITERITLITDNISELIRLIKETNNLQFKQEK